MLLKSKLNFSKDNYFENIFAIIIIKEPTWGPVSWEHSALINQLCKI